MVLETTDTLMYVIVERRCYRKCKGLRAVTNLVHVSHRDKSRAAGLWSVRRKEELPRR